MFRSNEYRKGPIEFTMDVCSALNRKDLDIPNMLEKSNLKCPMLKDKPYYVISLCPNATNFPPLIPEGRWRVELLLKYQNKYTMANINWYMGIVYPIPILSDI
ncbi:hypothetical protein FQR65_LT07852 [Abscondita terminalis]|nr:hypothetical protein FQR65_LT07852 [Abscondita terminalis]